MDEQVNPLERDHSLSVVLPGGLEKNATVHGSKPVMDLLVTLCGSYHLNPSDYTVEVLSTNKNNISFKPNSPIGSLEAEKIVLKPKGTEEKSRKPYMPEATVRLLINYNKSHKAVVRVNPRVPLEMLLPVVCDKCELNVETTVLLKESLSEEPLDLTKTLNEHGLREVFAKDTAGKDPVDHQHQPKTPEKAVTPTEVISPPPLQDLPKKEKKQKENTGFLSLFRRKKKPETEGAVSAPTSPGLTKQGAGSVTVLALSSSNTLPADMPKKRRAPQPPMIASQSVPNNLSSCHLRGAQRSAESTLRSTKRRAPPPPCVNIHQEVQAGTEVEGTVDSLNTLEELREYDESDSVNLSLSSPSSPHPSQPPSSSFPSRPSLAYFHEVADPYLPTLRGKDLSDARSALAKVLTSSISKGPLVKRLKNSATFPKLYNSSSSCMSVTQKRPDDGDYYAELESVLKSTPPTESEWKDPAHRRGMTTFKVVPSKKQMSYDAELILDVPDQCQITVEDQNVASPSPEDWNNQTEREEDPCSLDRAETETSSPSPEPFSQEILASDRLESVPSPPPPPSPQDSDIQHCPGSPVSEVRETDEKVKEEEEEEPEITSDATQAPPSDCNDEELADDDDQIKIKEEEEEPDVTSDATQAPPSDCNDEELTGEDQIKVKEEEEEPEVTSDMTQAPPSDCNDEELADDDDQIKIKEEEEEPEVTSEVTQAPPSDCNDEELADDDDDDQIKVKEEEEEPEVTSEVTQAPPSDCSDEELTGEDQINSETQSILLQSPSAQSLSTDTDQYGSCLDEEEGEEVVGVVEEEEEDCFPPPPSPVFFNEDMEVLQERTDDTTASTPPCSIPPSPTSNEATSTTPDQSSAAPSPPDKRSSVPSRFAQAVALAVQRSRLQSRGKGLGQEAATLPSTPRSAYQYEEEEVM